MRSTKGIGGCSGGEGGVVVGHGVAWHGAAWCGVRWTGRGVVAWGALQDPKVSSCELAP